MQFDIVFSLDESLKVAEKEINKIKKKTKKKSVKFIKWLINEEYILTKDEKLDYNGLYNKFLKSLK